MLVLALDPATKTGFAVGMRGTVMSSGMWDCHTLRDESAGMKLVRLRSKLAKIHEAFPSLSLVVFEAARNCSPKMQGALVVQAELQSVIKVWCQDTGLDFRGYSPSEVKKHATGNGNSNKAAMIAAAEARWPHIKLTDDNEADALWILDLAIAEYGQDAKQGESHAAEEADLSGQPGRKGRNLPADKAKGARTRRRSA